MRSFLYLHSQFNVWTFLISIGLAASIYFGIDLGTAQVKLKYFIETLLQVTAIVFGINLIGITINQGRESDWNNSSTTLKLIQNSALFIFSFYEHPRVSKLERNSFIELICNYPKITELCYSDDSQNVDYFIFRPNWDGVWYQISESPFADVKSQEDHWSISTLHELTLCSHTLLRIISTLRASDCCLLNEQQGSNGSRWFFKSLKKYENQNASVELVPENITITDAIKLIQLAIYSTHYLEEELREQAASVNWDTHKLSTFCLHYALALKWLSFITLKLQILRVANLKNRGVDTMSEATKKTTEKLKITEIQSFSSEINDIIANAKAEYGTAFRFTRLKQLSFPGLGWTIAFFLSVTLISPVVDVWVPSKWQNICLIAVYFLGVISFLESIRYALSLVWFPKTPSPKIRFGSRPPV